MKLQHFSRAILAGTVLAGVLAGTAYPAAAIVGGRDANRNYDGTVSMQVRFDGLGTGLCGGALIAPKWVLTAAHCGAEQLAAPAVIAVPGDAVTVRADSRDRTAGGQTAHGRKVYLHPGFTWGASWPASLADVALIELDRPIHAPLMPLGNRQVPVGHSARLIGWGLTEFPPAPGAVPPALLQERDSIRLPDSSCTGGFTSPGDVCLAAGACYGDSGSPALSRLKTPDTARPAWSSTGIASRETSPTDPCAEPTVYTDPTHEPFSTWIRTTMLTRTTAPHVPTRMTTVNPALLDALKLKAFE